VIAPLIIVTGAAMSPAVAARFPGHIRMLGGRQSARSISRLRMKDHISATLPHQMAPHAKREPYSASSFT
jgi:sulfoxide reductase catalytic subunit YedY